MAVMLALQARAMPQIGRLCLRSAHLHLRPCATASSVPMPVSYCARVYSRDWRYVATVSVLGADERVLAHG